MSVEFKKLNDRGLREFRSWLLSGAKDNLPVHLLESPKCSLTGYAFSHQLPEFKNRYEFGEYLVELLQDIPSSEIENDVQFWSSLSLIWFDSICPTTENGERGVQEISRYILQLDWHDYRHLVRNPWLTFRLHGERSKFLLLTSREESFPLSHFSFTYTQFGSSQMIFRNKQLIHLFYLLYFDKERDVLRSGLRGDNGGGPDRATKIFNQLELTHDIEHMTIEQILKLLPREFDRWKEGMSFD